MTSLCPDLCLFPLAILLSEDHVNVFIVVLLNVNNSNIFTSRYDIQEKRRRRESFV